MSHQESTNSSAKRLIELKLAEGYILANRQHFDNETLKSQLKEAGFDVDIINLLLDDAAIGNNDILPRQLDLQSYNDTAPSHRIKQLIDRLFVYKENHKQVVEHITSMGSVVIPELLLAFREREFRHAQNQTDTDHNTARLIAKSIVEIARNEQDPVVRDNISMQIINEMAIHVKWQVEISISSGEDFKLYEKAFDENLFHKACESALAMGQLKDSRALSYLLDVIKNKYSHPTIRENTIIALGQIGDQKAIPHLIDLIDKHDFNTHFAIDALAKMGNLAAVPPLLTSLENVSGSDIDDTRANIIWALGQLHDPRATPKLIEWVNTHKADMRVVAIQSLGNIGHPSAIPVLESCLNDFTVLHRQDMGGTFWIFRTYRKKKVCDFAFKSLEQIGTPEALNIIMKWQSPSI